MAINFRAQTKFAKALSRINMIISEFFEKTRYYSFKFSISNTAWWIGNYFQPLVGLQFWGKKNMTKYLDKYISKYVHASPCPSNNVIAISDYKIFVFWWQGEDYMPDLVRGCFHQLKSQNENVILLTKDNINEFSDIPDIIYRRVENGDISFTHLSDILRVSLLAKHGGLWLDSTCWIPNKISDEVKKMNFISPKTLNQPDMPLWSNSRWCTWCTGTNIINNPLFVFTRDLYYEFFKSHKFPTYLFNDYVYDYAYRNYSVVRDMIDAVPENNVKRNLLHYKLNSCWNYADYCSLIENNWVFKLSYKSIFKSKTDNGTITYFGHLFSK